MKGRKLPKKWFDAYRHLYGDQIDFEDGVADFEDEVAPKQRKRKKIVDNVPSEQDEQFVSVACLKRRGVVLHHSPNGGCRNPIEAAKFKRLGTSAGFPDLFFPKARKGYHGLFIELKRRDGGVLSSAQKYWRDLLKEEGYAWFEAHGAEECIKIVEDYLDIKF